MCSDLACVVRELAYHEGIAWTPACQYDQIFFSEVIGTCCVRDSIISASERVSFGSTRRSLDLYLSGIVN